MARTWNLDGKIILITGGGRGIGAAAAAELAKRGAKPVLVDVDEVALAATAARLGGDVVTAVADVTDLAACEAAVTKAVDRHGRLDGVWANAGIGAGGPVELVDPEAWTRVVQVNLIGVFYTVRAALPQVIDAKGHVAVTASLASFGHAPGMSAYTAAKAGVEAFADALRIEVAHQGVTVSCLHPSWIDTDMVREGDAENAAFRRLRAAMRPPFSRTHPVEAIVGPIADGFAQRRDRLFLPAVVQLGYRLRNAANTGVMVRDQLKAAPEMRQLFLEQLERDGVRGASISKRWSN